MALAPDRAGGQFQMARAAEDDRRLRDCRLGRIAETG